MKKTLLCFLLMLFLLLLASCSQDKEPVHDPASALIGEDGSCPYVLVRPDDAAQSIVSKVVDLRAVLNDATGVTFDLTTDFVKAGSSDFKEIDTEILIGSTNREISSALPDLRSGDWAILRRGTKIAVIGSDKLDEALAFFQDNYIMDGNVYIPDGTEEVHRNTYACDSVLIGTEELKNCTIHYPQSSSAAEKAANSLSAEINRLYGYRLPLSSVANRVENCIYISDTESGEMLENRMYLTGKNCLMLESGKLASIADSAAMFLSHLTAGEQNIAFPEGFSEKKTAVLSENKHIADDAFLDSLQAKADAMKESVMSSGSDYQTADNTRLWYVSADGDDANDGKTPETAIRTVAKAAELPVRSGDVILFRRGDLFRGTMKVPTGVTLSAYGEGDKPTICASIRNYADASLWVETEVPNVWRLTIKLENVGIITFDHDPQEIGNYDVLYGKMKILGSTLETVADLTEDLQFYSDLTSKDLYVCSTEGNPGERFFDIEIGHRTNILSCSDNAVVDNLHITLCGAHGVGNGTVKNITVQNCIIDWLGGSILTGFNGGNVTRYGNAVEVYGGCDGYHVQKNWIYQIYDTGITHQYNQNVAKNIMNNVEYNDNLIEYCYWCLEYYNVDAAHTETTNVHIYDNFCRFAGYGWGCLGRETSAPMYSMGSAPKVSKNIVTENNIFDRTKGWLILHSGNVEAPGELCFRNNTYIQEYGTNFVNFKGKVYLFDANADMTVLRDYGEDAPELYYIMEDAEQ